MRRVSRIEPNREPKCLRQGHAKGQGKENHRVKTKFAKNGDTLIVSVHGRLDAITAPDFESECAGRINGGELFLIADFTGLEYISSAGLRSILQIAKKLRQRKGDITFCGLSSMVENVFSISGFATMFSIHESLDKALLDRER